MVTPSKTKPKTKYNAITVRAKGITVITCNSMMSKFLLSYSGAERWEMADGILNTSLRFTGIL